MKAMMTMEKFQAMVKEILNGNVKLGYLNPALNLSIKDFRGWADHYGFGICPSGPMEIYYDGQPLPEGVKLLKRYGFC